MSFNFLNLLHSLKFCDCVLENMHYFYFPFELQVSVKYTNSITEYCQITTIANRKNIYTGKTHLRSHELSLF